MQVLNNSFIYGCKFMILYNQFTDSLMDIKNNSQKEVSEQLVASCDIIIINTIVMSLLTINILLKTFSKINKNDNKMLIQ